jgi:hypothetical protein
MATFTLFCLVVNEQAEEHFEISIPADVRVSQLKKTIHSVGQNGWFRGVDVNHLVLYKVTHSARAAAMN